MRKLLPNGFTLVELLVVITIIAILSMVGIVAFTDAQKNARDGKRKADMNAVAKALESNYSANSANPYPTAVAAAYFVGGAPTNPSLGGASYVYTLPGTSFTVCADLEKDTGNSDDSSALNYGINRANGSWYCVKNSQ